ncbi:putative phosphoric monoester hydrolase [Starmerella bacillaris]|uniref:Phosphoric monoester hydrolase n=1 Tax=Starmerella bacillaris TaxID=1247836 RepID=A0AAV5RP85_STABA|nr:putative phosphoric monoester hydrolase [Starmerella bacillaris]
MSPVKAILFTDFDGTITKQDSNDFLTDNYGMGYEKRRALNKQVISGEKTFREIFKEMMDSIKLPFKKCVDLVLENIELDPGFNDFYTWSLENNVPVIVLSSGMEPIIRALLTKLVGESAQSIKIVSNNVKLEDEGNSWEIVYHDDSDFGHDKSSTIKKYLKPGRPILLYAGDGISDVSAAKETDLLFAKKGQDLITYCKQQNIKYTEFETYASIHERIAKIVDGTETVDSIVSK